MYAISFDLDTSMLEASYGPNSSNAYNEIRKELTANGFDWTQGSVYFGDETVDAVKCVLVVQSMTKKFPWFASSVRDIRMLRIEENNDLKQAVESI
jgi:virulence-associated protein VapD